MKIAKPFEQHFSKACRMISREIEDVAESFMSVTNASASDVDEVQATLEAMILYVEYQFIFVMKRFRDGVISQSEYLDATEKYSGVHKIGTLIIRSGDLHWSLRHNCSGIGSILFDVLKSTSP